MKTFAKTLLFAAIFATTASCKEFLEEDPRGRLASQYFFASEGDLDAAVHALYGVVRNAQEGNHKTGTRSLAGSDLSTHPGSNKFHLRQHDQMNVTSANEWSVYMWEEHFRIVKSANYIINNAERTPAGEDAIRAVLAQAHYWRAYAYFMLVRVYGAVPVRLKEEIDYHAKPSSVEEIYNEVILPDLEYAETYLRISYPNAPFTNKAIGRVAAKATLAYVYMSMAGWPLNLGTPYYELAAAKAKEVIDGVENGTYNHSLLPEYWMIHSQQYNYSNPEVLGGVYFTRDGQPRDSRIWDLNQDLMCSGYNDTNGEIKFWAEFPDGPRKEATYVPKYLRTNGTLVDWWTLEDLPVCAPSFMKTAEANARDVEWDYTSHTAMSSPGEKTSHIVRLAEVYCWYAEAVGRAGLTGEITNALKYLNMVRNRADGFGPVADRSTVGVPPTPHVAEYVNKYPASMSGTDLAAAAYNEHNWEMAGYYASAIAGVWWNMFRMYQPAKDHFEYRKLNPQVEVAPGIFRRERVLLPAEGDDGVWRDSRMYSLPPYQDTDLNPELIRP